MASEEKIDKLLIQKMGGTGVRFLAILMDLARVPNTPTWIQGRDPIGRGIILIGDEDLGEGPEAGLLRQTLLNDLASGGCPSMVCAIAAAPCATEAIVAAVDGPATEVLLHAERGTGKTITEGLIALILSKRHVQAGYPGPFRILWVHDSLLSAGVKTARSLELPLWGGGWTLHDDRRTARFTLAGRQLIAVDFVGAADEASAQRLRASAHHVICEELVPSLSDSVGITEDQFDLAKTSTLRQDTETPRRVVVGSTNPGSPEHWAYKRFFTGQHPERVAIRIPASDRLSVEEQATLAGSFANNPTLRRRLAQGEWVMLELGASVAEGFDANVHLAKRPLTCDPNYLLAIGWDGGHSPSAVIGQQVNGTCRIYAGLNMMGAGVLELIEAKLAPWLREHAPWTLENGGLDLINILDPNMSVPGQVSMVESAELMIVEKLGGRVVKGPVRWAPRREALLRALRPGHEHGKAPLVISPDEGTELLVAALEGRWYYGTVNGQVDRARPMKPNSPWADLGDALCYLTGWLYGGDMMETFRQHKPITVETQFSLDRPGDQSFDVGPSIFR